MKALTTGISFALLMGLSVSANATLFDLYDGIIADDRGTYSQSDDMYWIQNLNLFVGMTYDEQVIAIREFDYQGPYNMTDFHMATYSDINFLLDLSSLSEITAVFTPTPHPDPTEPILMWSGRTTRFYADNAHYTYIIDLPPGEEYNGRFFPTWDDSPTFPGAWAVAYAAPAQSPVPEPATMLLVGTGLVGLVGSRLKRKKK